MAFDHLAQCSINGCARARSFWGPTLSPERQSARMSNNKNGGLDQYDKV